MKLVEAPYGIGEHGGIVNVTVVGVTLVGTVRMLPIITPIVPSRFVPVIVTGVPTGPLVAE